MVEEILSPEAISCYRTSLGARKGKFDGLEYHTAGDREKNSSAAEVCRVQFCYPVDFNWLEKPA